MSLNDEDKHWILIQLAALQQRIEMRPDTKFSDMRTAIDTNLPSPAELRVRTHTAVMRALDLDRRLQNNRPPKLEPPN